MAYEELVDLAVFARVVTAGSFTAAARDLGISKSAASRSVSRLEDRLGTRLLNRTTRQLAVTEAGREIHGRAVRMVAEAEAAELAAARLAEGPRGTLRVNGPVIFGERYLAPLLPGFLEQHPDVRIELSLTDQFVDVVDEGWDVAVRIAALADSSLVARKLAPAQGAIVASPAYLERRGVPRTPADLAAHDCIRYSLMSAQMEWRFVDADGKPVAVPIEGRLESDHGGSILQAVIGGAGIAMLPLFICGEALREGRVVSLLEDWLPESRSAIWAVYPHSRHVSPKVRAFVDFLVAELRDCALFRRG